MAIEITRIALPYTAERLRNGPGFPSSVKFTIYKDKSDLYNVERIVDIDGTDREDQYLQGVNSEKLKEFLSRLLTFISDKFVDSSRSRFNQPFVSGKLILVLNGISPLEQDEKNGWNEVSKVGDRYNVESVVCYNNDTLKSTLLYSDLSEEQYLYILFNLAYSYSYHILKEEPDLRSWLIKGTSRIQPTSFSTLRTIL